MAKFLLTEEEKKSILSKYYSEEVVSEQKFKFWAKLFGKSSADDVAAKLADDAALQIDKILGNALTKSSTVDKGVQMIVSGQSGKGIPIASIQKAIDDVVAGRKTAEEVQNVFPRFLADGTDFRQTMVNLLKRKKGTPVAPPQATKADYRAQVSQSQSRYGGGSN